MILIVSGGTRPSKVLLKKYSEISDFIIAADKGALALIEDGIDFDLLLGDFDSLDLESVKKHAISFLQRKNNDASSIDRIRKYKRQKEFTDTEAAINEALKQDTDEIILLGATGSRCDHFLSSLGLFRKCIKRGVKLSIIDDNNTITVIDKSCKVKKSRKYISFNAYGADVENFTLSGFKYPLENYTLTTFDLLNISNEIIEDEATVSFSSGQVLVIESND